MTSPLTKNDFPIQNIWIFKSFFSIVLYFLVFLFITRSIFEVVFYLIFFIIASAFSSAFMYIRVNAFNFEFKENMVTLRQGILSKQQRDMQYSTIQNIIIKRDLFSRLLGLASFTFENAAGGGGYSNLMKASKNNSYSVYNRDFIGFSGNLVCIPGLQTLDAEKLKVFLMERMTANQTVGDVSGL